LFLRRASEEEKKISKKDERTDVRGKGIGDESS